MIEKDFDKVLNTINSSSDKIKENVVSLKNDIEDIENKIESTSFNSYKKIEESLNYLKDEVIDASHKLNEFDYNKNIKKTNLLVDYYETIVSSKNDLMSQKITSIDDCILYLDELSNERKDLFKNYENILDNEILINDEYINSINDIFETNFIDYKETLLKYQNELTNILKEYETSINSITKDFLLEYQSFTRENDNLRNEYNNKREIIYSNIPTIKDIINNSNSELIASSFDNLISLNKKDYLNRLSNIKKEFKERNIYILDRIEQFLKEYLLLNDVNAKKEKIKNEFADANETLGIIDGIDNDQELNEIITKIFIELRENTYYKYKERIESLEKEYLEIKEMANSSKLLEYFIMNYHKENPVIINELSKHNIYKTLGENYKIYINNSYTNVFKFNIKSILLIKDLKLATNTFIFNKESIISKYKNELKNKILTLNKELDKAYNKYKIKVAKEKYISNSLKSLDEKTKIFLYYQIESSKINRKAIELKNMYKLAYDLKNKEKVMDLVEPNMSLDKIVTEYEVVENSYKTIYNQEIESINKTKIRNEVENLSNYKFAYSFLNHRLLVANQMLDMAKTEYTLRVNFLSEILKESTKYSSNRINNIISSYMEKIDDINRIKNTELKSILTRLELIDETKKKEIIKKENIEKDNLISILDEFKLASSKIMLILKNDSDINFNKDNKKHLTENVIEGISNAQSIRNKSIEVALKTIEKANEDFESLMKSLETDSIDYVSCYKSYKEIYDREKERLLLALDNESAPYLDRIKEINNSFKNNYMDNYYLVDNEYKNNSNDLYDNLIKEYNNIDKKYYIDMDIDSLNSSLNNNNKNIDELYNKKYMDLNNSYSYLVNKINQINESKIKSIDDDFKKSYSKLKNEYLTDISNSSSIIKEIEKTNKNTIKELSKLFKINSKKYYFEYGAFIDYYNSRLNRVYKKLKLKYNKNDINILK